MTPEEIEERYGKDALNMMYDCLLQNTVHGLADWVLSMYSEQDIDAWIKQLKADEEDESC
jgi:hypothetical protein